jgi:hypothetical protein
MLIEQTQWTGPGGWRVVRTPTTMPAPHLVLYFASNAALEGGTVDQELRARYPDARLLGCSTAGEICGTSVADDTVVATAIHFESSRVQSAYGSIDRADCSATVGERLARQLDPEGLVHAFVLAEGIDVNGSELVEGLRRGLRPDVAVTGALAGDGERFERTTVALDGEARAGGVAVVGLYGERLRIGFGSMGGWDQFGPERLITRSRGNVLYELDGDSALDLYRTYLGRYAAELPASGLLFPLSLRGVDGDPPVVRTILGIDESAGSLIFAGDLPEGSYARLMKANVDRLIDGAQGAANASHEGLTGESPDLALLISCVGRKLVLRQRVEEEVESVRDVLGEATVLSGFYSYGEIAPFSASARCELHNQTMTITTISER